MNFMKANVMVGTQDNYGMAAVRVRPPLRCPDACSDAQMLIRASWTACAPNAQASATRYLRIYFCWIIPVHLALYVFLNS